MKNNREKKNKKTEEGDFSEEWLEDIIEISEEGDFIEESPEERIGIFEEEYSGEE